MEFAPHRNQSYIAWSAVWRSLRTRWRQLLRDTTNDERSYFINKQAE